MEQAMEQSLKQNLLLEQALGLGLDVLSLVL
jgi:hypothetical protein